MYAICFKSFFFLLLSVIHQEILLDSKGEKTFKKKKKTYFSIGVGIQFPSLLPAYNRRKMYQICMHHTVSYHKPPAEPRVHVYIIIFVRMLTELKLAFHAFKWFTGGGQQTEKRGKIFFSNSDERDAPRVKCLSYARVTYERTQPLGLLYPRGINCLRAN